MQGVCVTLPLLPTAEMVEKIFSNVEELVPLHEALLEKLQQRQADSPVVVRVSDVFVEHLADMFRLYTAYCAAQNESLVR